MAPNEKKPANSNVTSGGSEAPGDSDHGNGELVLADRDDRLSMTSSESMESFVNYIPTPPDGGWGWVIVAASLVNNLIVDGIGYSFGVFLVKFTEYFKTTKSKVSLVGSLLCGVYLFVGPVVSALTNKFGCRPVAFVGSIIASASFVLATFSPTVDILILTYGVMGGFGLGMIYLPSIVSVGYYFQKKRALATGIAVSGSGIGTFIFAPLSEYLLQELDWKNALLVIAGITLQAAVCSMLMRPLLPPAPKPHDKRPRAKNLLDRIKEQRRHGRNRTISETSNYAYSVRDNNAVLERVMQAKLLRERRLQDTDSEMGSLPSIFFVKQPLGRKDSRVHKLSFSERGDVTMPSPSVLSVPRIVLHDGSTETGMLPVLTEGVPVNIVREASPEVPTGDASPGAEKSTSPGSERPTSPGGRGSVGSQDTPRRVGDDAVSSVGDDQFADAETGTFVDAELGEGTLTERSDYFTPPASPLSSPTTPDPMTTPIKFMDDKEDPEKALTNGGFPAHLRQHVQEVTPLIQQAPSKMTIVTLGSEKNVWRLKNHLHGSHAAVAGPSMHSLSVSKKDLARPLYRKDIFYSGSVLNIPQYKSQTDMKSYITSITTIPGEMALIGGESKFWGYLCLPQSVKDTLQQMLDFSLLKDPGFMLIMLGNVLTFLGFYVPFVYCVDFAVSMGIDFSKAAILISVIGITNTVGRVVTGWLADMWKINSLVITYVSIFICGLSTAAFPFCRNYALLCVAASVFGLSVAAFISLSSILICDLLGLEKLTNGFGLMTLFRGMAAMAGPPLAGFVYDNTHTYDASFYLGGALLAAGAACHLALKLPCFNTKAPDAVLDLIEDLENDTSSDFRPELVAIEEVTPV